VRLDAPDQTAILLVDIAPTRANPEALQIFQARNVWVVTFPPSGRGVDVEYDAPTSRNQRLAPLHLHRPLRGVSSSSHAVLQPVDTA
jgi:hypothetical protein